MYNMLIVDDNPWDRDGISEILDWNSMGINIVGTCSNGKQALERIDLLRPDIILSDIAMPIINGIELAEKVKEYSENIKIIFMSSYNEFNFAKSAINLDIYGYILKPIDPDELKQVVNRILNINEKETFLQKEKEEMKNQLNQSLPILIQQFLLDFLFGLYSDLDDIQKRFNFFNIFITPNSNIQVVSLEMENYEQIMYNMNISDRYLTVQVVKNIINFFCRDNLKIFTVQTSIKEFGLLIFYNGPVNGEDRIDLLDIAILIKEKVLEKLKINIIAGISNSSNNLLDVPKLYHQSVDSIKTKFYSDGMQVIQYREIEIVKKNSFEESLDLQALYKELNEVIPFGEDKDIKKFIDKYLCGMDLIKTENYIKSFSFSVINSTQIILINSNESFKNIFDEEFILWQKLNKFETIKDIKNWLYNILKSVKDYLSSKHQSMHSKIVEDIKEIIQNRYYMQLTIGDIADSVYFSAIHANNIFKKVTGKTIFDYLVEYRIEKAKELLKDPYSRVYLVSENVGYTNKSHFCMIFKKHTGLTPNEYKNKNIIQK